MDAIVAIWGALCCVKLRSELIKLSVRTLTLNAIEKIHRCPGEDCTIDSIRVFDTHPSRQKASVAPAESDDFPKSLILLLQLGQD